MALRIQADLWGFLLYQLKHLAMENITLYTQKIIFGILEMHLVIKTFFLDHLNIHLMF